jgi:hypothetical protein
MSSAMTMAVRRRDAPQTEKANRRETVPCHDVRNTPAIRGPEADPPGS